MKTVATVTKHTSILKAILESSLKNLSEKSQGKSMYILNLNLTADSEEAKEFWRKHPGRLEYLLKKYSEDIVDRTVEKKQEQQQQ